jgi:hypothetical protein
LSDFDEGTVLAMLGAGSASRAAVESIQYHGLASLLNGTAQTLSEIASLSGLPLTDIDHGVQALIGAGRIDLDGDRVTGVGGLTLTATAHSLSLPNAEMHTWCGLDAVGIPAALGLTATVQTRCPQCGNRITVDVDEGSATAAGPVTLFCPTAPVYENVRAEFCAAANLFCSPTHVTLWGQDNPSASGEDLDLAATTKLGQAIWGHYQHEPSARG